MLNIAFLGLLGGLSIVSTLGILAARNVKSRSEEIHVRHSKRRRTDQGDKPNYHDSAKTNQNAPDAMETAASVGAKNELPLANTGR